MLRLCCVALAMLVVTSDVFAGGRSFFRPRVQNIIVQNQAVPRPPVQNIIVQPQVQDDCHDRSTQNIIVQRPRYAAPATQNIIIQNHR